MSLVLVTGGSGCGKTEYIYRKLIEQSVAEPDGHFFLIVPEQATMQAQKEIVRLHPRQGTMNLDMENDGTETAGRGAEGRADFVCPAFKPCRVY